MWDVNNKVFLITGAASGIGAGVVKAVLEKGAKHVAILDVNEKLGKELEAEMNSKYGADKAMFIKCDVTTDLTSSFEQALQKFDYIDVVVNNAGIMNDRADIYEKEIAVNVTALITSSLKSYDLMRKDKNGKGGTIVNISSVVGLVQSPSIPVYSATKSAVLQFSNCLGHEFNFARTGVRVVTICFGQTNTNLITAIGSIDKESEEMLATALKNIGMQSIDSAVNGLVHAYENGAAASTWLITCDRPAQDITSRVKKTFEILSEGALK